MPDDLLYESGRTRVFRVASGPTRPGAIRKELTGPGAVERLRNELTMLGRLAGVPGVPLLLSKSDDQQVLLIDDGGTALAASIVRAPMGVPELLDFAVELTEVVAAMHRRRVVHKDINPANVVVVRREAGPRRPILIDFDLASTSAEERPGFTHHRDIIGTLPYIAPEQTGRTGWPVDQRADLYGLGSTLYELATGSPPFGHGDDPLRLTHDLLTRTPTPPSEVNPAVPASFSAIVAHLLEKEPDRRYQSAEGVLHDLRQLRDHYARGTEGTLEIGRRDFPGRLQAPARLVGRSAEIESARRAFSESVAGRCPGALISGDSGVGKSSLIDRLRPIVTEAGGWFVFGKFDQFRQGPGSDGVRQAMRALARMLLAEPETELAAARVRLHEALGADAAVMAADPEFGALLGVSTGTGTTDPRTAQARLVQAGLAVLKSLAGPQRPIVMVIDDLQWASPTALGLFDAVYSSDGLPGLLLIGAYRHNEVDDTHPLAAALPRWRKQARPPVDITLGNLGPADVCQLLGELLRLPAHDLDAVGAAIRERTDGNPFDTVELVNALRREGALVPGESGWIWDPAALRHHVGRGDVVELIEARIAALADQTRELVYTMACLGGDVELGLLRAAIGDPADAGGQLTGMLAPALEDGLLVTEHGAATSVRFRHDRVRQAAYAGMSAMVRPARHLELARMLARFPQFEPVAAEQYLAAIDEVTELRERQTVAELFTVAAARARLQANYDLMDNYLAAAEGLLAPDPGTDSGLRQRLGIERHTALFGSGRLDEADELYTRVAPTIDPVQRAQLAVIQISSLAHRARPQEAVELGVGLLADLGHPAPAPADLPGVIDRGIDALRAWAISGSAADDLRRPDNEDPRAVAIASLIYRLIPASFFCGSPLMPWLVTEARRLWDEGGPCADLVGALAHAPYVTVPSRQDYASAYTAVRRVLEVSHARGYDPAAGQAEYIFAICAAPWFEPLEDTIRHARQARELLLRGGDLYHACFTYYASIPQLLDSAPALADVVAEAEAGLSFAARIGNEWGATTIRGWPQAARALRGETAVLGGFDDASFKLDEQLAAFSDNPIAAVNLRAAHALVSAIFGDADALVEHSGAAVPILPFVVPTQSMTLVLLMHGLALAERARVADAAQRAALLAELDERRAWLAGRAADCPANFLHLRRLLDAERAWASGDAMGALRAFDAARREVAGRQRPWQRAYITERLAKCLLAHNMEYTGQATLHEALHLYREWGAAGKVTQLEQDYPFLAGVRGSAAAVTSTGPFSGNVSASTIDMLAVVRASQALSSETTLAGLQDRVTEVLAAMTGASGVRIVLRIADASGWVLPHPVGDGHNVLDIDHPDVAALLPLSAFRYAERTRQPLLVEDATRDDRFSRDPYLHDVPVCSLLVVPILSRGEPRAMLLLENRRIRGAFGPNRLDAVELIAGQLSVSLDNALLYAALEDKVTERTEALRAANEQLELLAITDPLTGLANRRRLTEALDLEWHRAIRLRTPVGIAIMDIDHFKKYNDHYGHLAGDDCLRRVAATISRSVRDADIVARYGGEEFMVVLPGADLATVASAAERIRVAVERLAEPHELADTGLVTLSIGFAAAEPTRSNHHEQLTKLADAALYEAKRAGRNRTCAAPLLPRSG
ncbi:diguanylate cyclase [Dactylosporangium aurantiacum]|uniref:Diguanylate cyclase n=1 Tax=Dactylosporangium aurantiacum TaxID=35754 RepID=A0A9Q9IMV6_9ACTN|nr:diguanylate cyclase [Dactylosporangium aurantiacum]MDG6108254.1 diguanylate cyclase [Dactylosporangium aurantiacum]UWZ58551.1 diguanylate cyclase [Dactylosporangium aurantiacum]